MNAFRGTGVAIVTPFHEDHTLDFHSLRKIVRHLIQGNVEYLVVLGTTGETATLNPNEQSLVIETILDENNSRLPIVLGAGGNQTSAVCQQLHTLSKRYPLDGFLSVSPYYNKPSQEGIFQHYQALAEATDLPLILYNVPGRTASNMLAETSLRLAELENIVAIKEASGNLEQCMEILRNKPDSFSLISGEDALTYPLIGLGAEGAISVTANAFPKQFGEMTRAALSGKYSEARKLHYSLLPLIQLNFWEGNPSGVKCQLAHLHLCGEYVRLPLVPASDNLRVKTIGAIDALAKS